MTFIRLKGFLMFLLLWPGWLGAQPWQPLQIAEQFVAPEGWPQMHSYLCCEAAGQAKRQTLGQQIPRQLRRRCQLLHQDSARAVVAVELRDSAAARNDFYLHFTRQGAGWKLEAVRSLAMTALGAPMLKMLTEMPADEVARYNQAHPAASRDFMVGNIRLWMGPDADIIRHFTQHRRDFERVVRLVRAGQYFAAPDSAAAELAANADPAIQALLQSLFISRLSRPGPDCGACLEFTIGGRVNSTVGLLYQPNAAAVPAMSPDGIMVMRPLGNGWYLFKTS
ncbi:hypothetical protein [Hymenobacter persicinus]|uniref:Uncharacterized protein n=1 Tax=Hymenobacter persicinus TaxID=2025506 RepID=A0A4Q5LBJ2_9BACT|nr:hypothetical protein [Hymenobacter persicinus]RYU78460.1 hypothetical protein EWM57_13725 [Hymenobacter persicinus]